MARRRSSPYPPIAYSRGGVLRDAEDMRTAILEEAKLQRSLGQPVLALLLETTGKYLPHSSLERLRNS